MRLIGSAPVEAAAAQAALMPGEPA